MTTQQPSAAPAGSASAPTAPVRTRFAPSPTGFQHVGGYRTALFSWLLARHYGGQFLLRIEDTDIARTVPGAVEAVIEGFNWLGTSIDEGPIIGGAYGPYFQTQRKAIYQEYAEQLVRSGHAYRCYCSRERLEQVRENQRKNNLPPRYDRHCRNLSAEERAAKTAEGATYVVRLATPLDGQTRVEDELRGDIVFENANLDDLVLLKSDGYATYHLAAIVDDHLMQITHVLRAEEWISSAPLNILTFRALGWEPPRYVHVPDVLGPQGKGKLSKRFGAKPLLWYRDEGYLPEALVNYMALLGWSPPDGKDILSLHELVERFTLDRVGTSPARYDEERLLVMNGQHIRLLSPKELTRRTLPFMERPHEQGGLPDSVARPLDSAYVERVLRLEQERMKTLGEAAQMTEFFFTKDITYPPTLLIGKKMDQATTLEGLRRTEQTLTEFSPWEAHPMEERMRALADELGLKPGQLFTSVRVAVTGRTVSPPLFETMEVLGREITLARLHQAIALLEGYSPEKAEG